MALRSSNGRLLLRGLEVPAGMVQSEFERRLPAVHRVRRTQMYKKRGTVYSMDMFASWGTSNWRLERVWTWRRSGSGWSWPLSGSRVRVVGPQLVQAQCRIETKSIAHVKFQYVLRGPTRTCTQANNHQISSPDRVSGKSEATSQIVTLSPLIWTKREKKYQGARR